MSAGVDFLDAIPIPDLQELDTYCATGFTQQFCKLRYLCFRLIYDENSEPLRIPDLPSLLGLRLEMAPGHLALDSAREFVRFDQHPRLTHMVVVGAGGFWYPTLRSCQFVSSSQALVAAAFINVTLLDESAQLLQRTPNLKFLYYGSIKHRCGPDDDLARLDLQRFAFRSQLCQGQSCRFQNRVRYPLTTDVVMDASAPDHTHELYLSTFPPVMRTIFNTVDLHSTNINRSSVPLPIGDLNRC